MSILVYSQTMFALYRCLSALPEDYKSLVPKVLVETMTELNSSFISRVNLATGAVIPETKSLGKGYFLKLETKKKFIPFLNLFL
jgi:hypothetical protein